MVAYNVPQNVALVANVTEEEEEEDAVAANVLRVAVLAVNANENILDEDKECAGFIKKIL